MGLHRGWRVTWDRGAWLAQAWDPNRGAYESRRFNPDKDPANDKTAANDWARARHLALATGRRAVLTTERTSVLAEGYLKDLERLRTVAGHRADVGRILTQLAVVVPDITAPGAAETVREWIRSLEQPPRRLAVRTRNRYLSTVQSFAKWLVSEGQLAVSPFAELEPDPVPVRLPDQLAITELRTLVARRRDPHRRRFLLELYAGLREAEAAGLEWSKIDLAGDVLQVIGKGDKERLVPIQAELKAEMLTWKPQVGRVCPTATAHSWRDFQAFLARAKIERDGRSPHTLRHCYAGLMTATGVPSILLAAYMGHTSVATTAGYAGMATRYVAAVTDWPRGQFRLAVRPSAARPASKRPARRAGTRAARRPARPARGRRR